DVVGQAAQGEQRGQHGQGVHAEHDRGGDRREPPALLVDRVQRRRRARGGQQRDDQRGQQDKGGGAAEARARAAGSPQAPAGLGPERVRRKVKGAAARCRASSHGASYHGASYHGGGRVGVLHRGAL